MTTTATKENNEEKQPGTEQQKNDIPWPLEEPCLLGIDEAGRGPVLGPMVYAASYCPISKIPFLNKLDANDSKQLSEEQRDRMREKIDSSDFIRSSVNVLSAQELSEKMLRKSKVNLNVISHNSALDLVKQAMDKGVNITQIYVDTVGTPQTYAQKFKDQFPSLEKVTVEKKADSKFKIVSVASIVAKTTRDKCLKDWCYPEIIRSNQFINIHNNENTQISFSDKKGSGYPSDPSTKSWMAKNCDSMFGFPTLVRFSWGTTRTILEKDAVQVDWESDEEDDGSGDQSYEPKSKQAKIKTKDIKSFFGAPSSSKSSKNNTANMPISKSKPIKKPQLVYPNVLKRINLKRSATIMN